MLVSMYPSLTFRPCLLARAGVTSRPPRPIRGRITRPRSIRLSMMGMATLELTVNPIPCAWRMIAVLMPITSPSRFTQRAAAVPVVDRRVGLDHVVQFFRPFRHHRTAPRADYAKGDRRPTLERQSVPKRQHPVSDLKRVRVTKGRGRKALRVDLDHRDVRELVGPDYPGRVGVSVREAHYDAIGRFYNVAVGYKVAVGSDDNARTRPFVGEVEEQPARHRLDRDRRYGRSHLLHELGERGQRAQVGTAGEVGESR